METILQLLNRIQWDEEFCQGDFEIGIYDRIRDAIEFLPFKQLKIEKGNHFSFTACIQGEIATIPFHRIHEVREAGETIWKRCRR